VAGGATASGFTSVSASTGATGGGPSTHVSAQPSKQQRPLSGQSENGGKG
jgi:hypothetical protein